MEVYLICFDISDDGIRNRIGKELLKYGDRVQKSVFEISVRKIEELQHLKEVLAEIVVEEDNNIRFYRLCQNCRQASSTLRGEAVASFPAVVIV